MSIDNDKIDFTDKQEDSDIEIAIRLIRSLNGIAELIKSHGNTKSNTICVEMVKTKLRKMRNPYAKQMVIDKLKETDRFSRCRNDE